jgi:hypothetical protein
MPVSSRPTARRESRRASGAAGDDLRREAQILAHARHPGVIEVIDVRLNATTTEIDTLAPDGVALGRIALGVEELAGVIATVATTVADLHDIGVAIGSIAVDAVVIGDDGRAVLIDFTRSAWLDGPPSKWAAHRLARRDDRMLGDLLAALLDRCAPRAVAGPLEATSRWSRLGRRAGVAHGHDPVVAVSRWAADAAAGTVSSRRLAEGLATEIPGARLPHRPRPADRAASTAADRAASTAEDQPATGAGAVGGWEGAADGPGAPDDGTIMSDEALERWFATTPGQDPADDREVPPPALPLATRIRHAAQVALGVAMAAGLVVGTRALSHPRIAVGAICLSGSPRCATFRDGTLTVGSRRYGVGQAGDVAVIGRWTCGEATLALLRPTSGDVWVYAAWPADDTPVRPALDASVPGARSLTVRAHGGCDTLLATSHDGRQVAVPVPHAP